ncbi:MAG: tripartite tricarboxylate transporter substrate binding protein [Betaproteobacteria bacterium]|nr:tripartite tricarboxylate transporter substrate binding protein [Betaproteobacteria bacterium]
MLPLAQAQSDRFPVRPITMVVPFPPGGVADTVGRPMAEAMGRMLGQAVIVENKAGAGGALGMAQVARAKPDGYTLLMGLVSISTIPVADEVLGRTPAFSLQQLTPIARVTADPTVLAVRADAPYKNYAEFERYVKANQGKLNYGSSGNYGTMHVPMEMLKLERELKITHVAYKGAGPAVLALLAGEIDLVATGPASILSQVKAGKLRVLAHWGKEPLQSLPEVPSLEQLGVPIQFSQWSGIFVPSGTPASIIEQLRQAAKQAASDPKVQSTITNAGSPIQYLDAPDFAQFWARDAKLLADIVRRIGKVE